MSKYFSLGLEGFLHLARAWREPDIGEYEAAIICFELADSFRFYKERTTDRNALLNAASVSLSAAEDFPHLSDVYLIRAAYNCKKITTGSKSLNNYGQAKILLNKVDWLASS